MARFDDIAQGISIFGSLPWWWGVVDLFVMSIIISGIIIVLRVKKPILITVLLSLLFYSGVGLIEYAFHFIPHIIIRFSFMIPWCIGFGIGAQAYCVALLLQGVATFLLSWFFIFLIHRVGSKKYPMENDGV